MLRTFRKDERGSYLVEFAMLFLPLFTILLGGVELGYYAFAKAHAEGVMRDVARQSAIGSFFPTDSSDTEAPIDKAKRYASKRLGAIPGVEVTYDIRNYSDFTEVSQPEPVFSRPEENEDEAEFPLAGDCYVDWNDSETWDVAGGAGLGGAEEIIFFGVNIQYKPFFTLTTALTGLDKFNYSTNTAVKNEPFATAVTYKKCVTCVQNDGGHLATPNCENPDA